MTPSFETLAALAPQERTVLRPRPQRLLDLDLQHAVNLADVTGPTIL